MATLLLFAMAGEFAHIGWYGSAAITVIAALSTMRWLWAFLFGFLLGRSMRR